MYCDNCASHDVERVPPFGTQTGVRCGRCGYLNDVMITPGFGQIEVWDGSRDYYVDYYVIEGDPEEDWDNARIQLAWYKNPMQPWMAWGRNAEGVALDMLRNIGVIGSGDSCPNCHNDDRDRLIWLSDDGDDGVVCEMCGTRYFPSARERPFSPFRNAVPTMAVALNDPLHQENHQVYWMMVEYGVDEMVDLHMSVTPARHMREVVDAFVDWAIGKTTVKDCVAELQRVQHIVAADIRRKEG